MPGRLLLTDTGIQLQINVVSRSCTHLQVRYRATPTNYIPYFFQILGTSNYSEPCVKNYQKTTCIRRWDSEIYRNLTTISTFFGTSRCTWKLSKREGISQWFTSPQAKQTNWLFYWNTVEWAKYLASANWVECQVSRLPSESTALWSSGRF